MRALTVTELKGPDAVRVTEVPEPDGDGQVLIDVHAVGISFPDLLRSQGLYQERSEPPYTLGAEFAGVVAAAPPAAGFKAGDRVAGLGTGAAAERLACPPESLMALPDSLSFEQGAGLLLNYETAVVALEIRGRMRPQEALLVHGAAGGTGTAAIQVAHALGGTAIGVVSSEEKERVAKEAGADHVVRGDGSWKDEVLALTGGRGVDLVFDPVGGDRMLDTMRSLALGGRWLVIGFVGGAIPQVPLNRVLLRNIDVVGSYYGGYVHARPEAEAEIRLRLGGMIASGHIRPVVGSVHPLEKGGEALRDLAERRALGKVVVTVR
ncbi:MAG: NADPH:quinone oxidoreductase family protein [Candidatus Dormibacteraeota bacterium]|nr:NADPH:quinone oxidoreductase family protein [Candidatus Dormibacteraeota bacterium]